VDNAAFLRALRKLYEDNRSGSVFVTFKSVQEIERAGKKAKAAKVLSTEATCLVRATNGKSGKKRTKISTAVHAKDVLSFQMQLHKIILQEMTSLKKVERKKKTKKIQHL